MELFWCRWKKWVRQDNDNRLYSEYDYAVMRCKESQFLELDSKDILAYRKRDIQIDVLIPNAKEAGRKYKNAVIDHVSVDEILLLLVKGEQV